MKIRKGFVSNSSSSSFIIGVAEKGFEFKIDLKTLLEISNNNNVEIIESLIEFDVYLTEEFGWGDMVFDDILVLSGLSLNEYEEIKEIFKNKGIIICMDVENSNSELIENLLEADNNIKIIQNN